MQRDRMGLRENNRNRNKNIYYVVQEPLLCCDTLCCSPLVDHDSKAGEGWTKQGGKRI
jgi:hypothetical protein